MGLAVLARRRWLPAVGLFGFSALLSAGMLGAMATPGAAQDGPTVNGTTMTVTFSSNVPVTEYGWNQLPNEASLSCGPGSTTDATGGPQSNSLECVFDPARTTGTVIANFTVAPTGPFTLVPFASSNNQTYVVLPPVTVTPATPPVVAPAPTAGPTAIEPNPNTIASGGGHRGMRDANAWFWVSFACGVVLICVGLVSMGSSPDADDSSSTYPDYSSGDEGLALPPRPHSPIPGLAYGGTIIEPPPSGPDGDQDDPEGTGTDGTGTEGDGGQATDGEDPPPLRTPIG